MKRIICVITCLLILFSGTALAATYTLPEKMQNQLAIGSGLKGTITITSDGDLSRTPFLNAVSDATLDLRGMASGQDLHYYVFQESGGKQTNLAELYKKEGKYYFRSDIVPGKILELSGFSVYLDSLFQNRGENPTLSSALMNYFKLPEDTREKQWKPVFNKYQNSLEMWLHDFTAKADVVKQENGSSAFDFSYVIPVDEVRKKLVSMFEEFSADAELLSLMDTIMTSEQKELYFNPSLLYFYQAAVDSLGIKSDIKLSKRVSALGDLINSKLVLPLDPGITGYDLLTIENSNGCSVYQLTGEDKALVIGIPPTDKLKEQEFEASVWISKIDDSKTDAEENKNFSVRADIKKSFSQYDDEEEKSHQTEDYSVKVYEDTTWLPDAFKEHELGEWHDIEADLSLHYHSKYSQNSATTLEIKASFKQNGSSVTVDGKVKTAAPWLFMPFEVTDPVEIGPDKPEITENYITDWISNAASMIHHNDSAETEPEELPAETAPPASEAMENAESESDISDSAEAAPLPEEPETGENAE